MNPEDVIRRLEQMRGAALTRQARLEKKWGIEKKRFQPTSQNKLSSCKTRKQWNS